MQHEPMLIVMLTHDDKTVLNAAEIFEQCKDSAAQYWGMKEEPLPPEEMKALYKRMRECGKTTVLEVVSYTEDKCLEGAQLAVDCGCDILMGTMFFDSVNRFCKEHDLRYMPFVGEVYDRPSILGGDIDGIIAEAKDHIAKGACGIDLLGYRFVGDAVELNRRLVAEVPAPVCIAGSINSFERLDEVTEADPWAFTIGSAFFENQFGEDFCTQINKVCAYMKEHAYA
ncbi:MAG: hypothetical protein J5851_02445 [Oscillospiraceae bacterium]|nr:hypothetical protein [Oscillospiraceae bacterium]